MRVSWAQIGSYARTKRRRSVCLRGRPTLLLVLREWNEVPLADALQVEERRLGIASIRDAVRAPSANRPPTFTSAEFDLFVRVSERYPHSTLDHEERVRDVGVAVPGNTLLGHHPKLGNAKTGPLRVPRKDFSSEIR